MPTVLVVDDSSVDRRLAGGLLRKADDLNVEFAVNGVDAIQQIEQNPPDLVVTDLMMPEMNGLELVANITRDHPPLPVILMTGRGSEEIAVEALRAGAASYVPKSVLASLLLDTVQNLLEAVREERCKDRLMNCMLQSEATFLLNNDAAMIAPLVNYIHRTVRAVGVPDDAEGIRLCVALEEALNNALFHGNLEIPSASRTGDCTRYRQLVEQRAQSPPFQHRTICVKAHISSSEATFVVRDQGPGFDPNDLPDPTDPENLEKACGRGLLLMRTFMDSVQFNRTGNEVTMVKRLDRHAAPG